MQKPVTDYEINDVSDAVSLIRRGEVLAYPTEAVWGLGCDPYQKDAFDRLLALKQRPVEKGVILISHDVDMLMPLLQDLPKNIQKQMLKSWQVSMHERATTWIVPSHSSIPLWITGQHDSIAVRVTQHPLSRDICQTLGHLLVSTSANPSGRPPATTKQQVKDYFSGIFIVNGLLGQSSEPSRIIDSRTGTVLRK
ncbi:L-threonylcarbamoyladenylate synthase [Acinetobacter sp. c3-l95]|uniref:L-threonylcarbamoyladenylate synthase n=1 Tax=Acinetobacter sp. c3-l95 TaxID=3342804 RepID=UPI0035B93CCE